MDLGSGCGLSGPLDGAAPHTGTTIVACLYDGGVVIGADSRVSTGTYVSNRASDKITPLWDNVYLLRSGSAADTQVVSDYVRYFAEQHVREVGEQPTVKTVANLVQQINYNNKTNLMAAMIVAGWDRHEGAQVYSMPIGGAMVAEPWITDGSGSSYIWGYMDSEFRHNMTREEAEAFVVESVGLAISQDGSSGGVIRTVTVTEAGAERRLYRGPEVPLFQEEAAPRGLLL
mmetsp:Transcript_47157/g.120303  ORF Transcript_47157/g.120303 Transcript_47157/m.120303 type:complete len:230 (-) Transcript_47157:19-708(-)|eukprot:jgi/Tetstr1/462501/TSEL_007491.t1